MNAMGFPPTPPGATKFAGREVAPPAAFPWPFGTYPVRVLGSYGTFSTDVDPRSLVSSAIWSSTNYIFVDIATGNDTTAAVVTSVTDTSKKAASIWKAIQLGNATGAPFRVIVKAGTYLRANSINGTSGAWTPTQPCSVEAWGGRVVTGPWDDLTWAADVTFTNTYSATRSNVLNVIDLAAATNKWGNYQELTKVADAATCNTTPGSWAQVGSTLYTRRSDSAAVTNTNIRAFIGGTATNCDLPNTAKDFYVSGVDMQGGAGGCLTTLSSATHNLVAVDCTMRYAGSAAVPACGLRTSSLHGIAAMFRCDASANTQDGFNVHVSGATADCYLLTVDCTGRDNGRGVSTSNNGWTTHEIMIGIDVNGVYEENFGANVHSVGDSRSWLVGTISRAGLGDTTLGGSIQSTAFRVNETSVYWLDNTLAVTSLYALAAYDSTAKIYTRGHRSSGALNISTGTIATY